MRQEIAATQKQIECSLIELVRNKFVVLYINK